MLPQGTTDSGDDTLAFNREARLRGTSSTRKENSGKQAGHGDAESQWTSHPRIRQPENFFSEDLQSLEELRAAGYATGFRIESVRVKDSSDEEIFENTDQGSDEEDSDSEEEEEKEDSQPESHEVFVNPNRMRPDANAGKDKEESGAERLPSKKPSRSKQHGRRCSYEHCLHPDNSSYFYTVAKDTVSGGQDWTALAGMTLCQSCYSRYRTYGDLRSRRNRSNAVAAQRKSRAALRPGRKGLKLANFKPKVCGMPNLGTMVTGTQRGPPSL